LRVTENDVESEGINRAINRAREADIKILLFDGTKELDAHTLSLKDDRSILALNKTDETGFKASIDGALHLSVLKNDGVDQLVERIVQSLKSIVGSSDAPALTRARHREALENAYAALERSMSAPLPELAAEDIRLAVRFLGTLTGRVDVEDLLDMIFRDFCIGK